MYLHIKLGSVEAKCAGFPAHPAAEWPTETNIFFEALPIIISKAASSCCHEQTNKLCHVTKGASVICQMCVST